MRYLCLVFIVSITQYIYPYDNYLNGSRSAALSGCAIALTDVWSVSHNQAGLAYIDNFSIAFSHERRYMVKELGNHSLAAAIPYKTGVFGFQTNYFGYSKYNEVKIGFAYALKLSKRLAAGLQLDHFQTSVTSIGTKNNWITFELGLQGKATNNLTIGLHLFNPLPLKINTNSTIQFPSTTRIGLAYNPANNAILLSEIQIGLQQQTLYRFGIEYYLCKDFAMRFGVSSNPFKYSFGFGYNYKKYTIGIAFAEHPNLGYSPVIDLKFNL